MGYISELRKKVGRMPIVAAFSVMVVISPAGLILFEKRKDDGYWDIPGGSIEFNETASDAARRELYEETGLKAKDIVLLDVYSGPLTCYTYFNGDVVSGVDVVYICRDYDGTLAAQEDEVTKLEWINPKELPEKMSTRNRRIISDLLERNLL